MKRPYQFNRSALHIFCDNCILLKISIELLYFNIPVNEWICVIDRPLCGQFSVYLNIWKWLLLMMWLSIWFSVFLFMCNERTLAVLMVNIFIFYLIIKYFSHTQEQISIIVVQTAQWKFNNEFSLTCYCPFFEVLSTNIYHASMTFFKMTTKTIKKRSIFNELRYYLLAHFHCALVSPQFSTFPSVMKKKIVYEKFDFN